MAETKKITDGQVQGLLQLLALLWELFKRFHPAPATAGAKKAEMQAGKTKALAQAEATLRSYGAIKDDGSVDWDLLGGKP